MCGIFAYVGEEPNAASTVLEGLKRLEYRGYDSWGVAVIPTSDEETKKQIVVKKKTGKIGTATIDELPASTIAFGHTRWATHGGVTDINAHPHLDCTGTIAVIHNGIVENYEPLRRWLTKQGHTFLSETDTEVIVHLIEEYGKRLMFTKAVQKAFNKLEGLNAVIAMHTSDHCVVAVRSGSPLVVGFGDHGNYLASDASALLPHTKQVHFMDDGQMAIVAGGGVMLFDVKTGARIKPRKQTLTWSINQVMKGTFPSFMLKEIYEQPGILAEIAANGLPQAQRLAAVFKQTEDTILVGCGTASYACIAGTYLLSLIAKRSAVAVAGSEFLYRQPFVTDKTLVLALSQSGETMDTMEAIKQAKAKHARVAALVNVMGSSLYRLADQPLTIGAGPEKGVASTKAFTGKLAHLLLLSYMLKGKPKVGQEIVVAAAKAAKKILSKSSVGAIKELAKLLKDREHMYVIGRGLSYPAGLEIALKIKEISYIHAEGFAGGELKHGVLALVEKGTPCIVLSPNDETYASTIANATEMKARGGFIIGLSHKPNSIFDVWIPIPDCKEATIIPMVIAGQLLAYYLTIEKGLDADMPRNLAKSVVVK